MSNQFHKDLTLADIHHIQAFEFANSAARLAASYVLADEGKVVRQTDDDSFYILIDFSVPTFIQITTDIDIKVAVDVLATADFIGAGSGDGVLRTDSSIEYVDGGDFVTLGLAINPVSIGTPVVADEMLFADIDDSFDVKKLTIQDIIDLVPFTGGGFNSSIWRSDISDQTAPPTDKRIEWNNVTQSSATELFIDDNDQNGTDVSAFLGLLVINDHIRIQLKDDALVEQVFKVTSITDNTTFFTFGVTNISANGGNIANNREVIVTFILAAGIPGGSEFADDVFRVIGSADATKKLAFEVDNLTTVTTRTIAVQDEAMTIPSTINHDTLTDSSIADDLHVHFEQIQVSFESDKVNSKSNVFELVSSFAYLGTNTLPTVVNITIKAIADVDGENGQIRIFDSTNANTVATSAVFSNTTPAIIDLGTVSNLPTGESIFEVQMLNDDAAGKKKTFVQSMGVFQNT